MFFFLVFPLRFHHHHHTHWNVMKEQPRQATDFYVSVSFPDWLLKHNENKNILPQSSFQVTFFFYVKEFTELWEMRLVVDGRRKRNVKKKRKKKKRVFEWGKKEKVRRAWMGTGRWLWLMIQSPQFLFFFCFRSKTLFFFFDLDVELRWRRLFMRQRPEKKIKNKKGIGQKGSHILRVISSRTGQGRNGWTRDSSALARQCQCIN